MMSMSIFSWEPQLRALVELARDHRKSWLTAIEMVDENHYIGADNHKNLFTLARHRPVAPPPGAPVPSDPQAGLAEKSSLRMVGKFHLGEMVNVFRHGSLVMDPAHQDTSSGGLGGGPLAMLGVDGSEQGDT